VAQGIGEGIHLNNTVPEISDIVRVVRKDIRPVHMLVFKLISELHIKPGKDLIPDTRRQQIIKSNDPVIFRMQFIQRSERPIGKTKLTGLLQISVVIVQVDG
ncbi:MAG: hypothetical protein ABUM51_10115, partial [Bacteroidota bacterium]